VIARGELDAATGQPIPDLPDDFDGWQWVRATSGPAAGRLVWIEYRYIPNPADVERGYTLRPVLIRLQYLAFQPSGLRWRYLIVDADTLKTITEGYAATGPDAMDFGITLAWKIATRRIRPTMADSVNRGETGGLRYEPDTKAGRAIQRLHRALQDVEDDDGSQSGAEAGQILHDWFTEEGTA
jgi:hypothetical protein